MTKTLPVGLPSDTTPQTYTGTKVKVFILDPSATAVITAVVTLAAAVAQGDVSASLSAVPNVTVPNGTVLDFGGHPITLGEDAALTNAAAPHVIAAAVGAVIANSTASFSNARQVPVTEDIAPTMSDDEETIKIQGRATPIRVMNGKDFKCTLKTLAGLTNPVVKELTIAGANLSGGTGAASNQKRILVEFDDGLAILALCNIGSAAPEGKAGSAQRYTFTANSTGKLFWCDMNEAAPTWREIGAVN